VPNSTGGALPCCDCSQPLLALSVNLLHCENSDAIGGKADIGRSRWLVWSGANDRCGSRVGQNAVMHNVALGPLDSQGEATDRGRADQIWGVRSLREIREPEAP
jgi:hypothetical protein